MTLRYLRLDRNRLFYVKKKSEPLWAARLFLIEFDAYDGTSATLKITAPVFLSRIGKARHELDLVIDTEDDRLRGVTAALADLFTTGRRFPVTADGARLDLRLCYSLRIHQTWIRISRRVWPETE